MEFRVERQMQFHANQIVGILGTFRKKRTARERERQGFSGNVHFLSRRMNTTGHDMYAVFWLKNGQESERVRAGDGKKYVLSRLRRRSVMCECMRQVPSFPCPILSPQIMKERVEETKIEGFLLNKILVKIPGSDYMPACFFREREREIEYVKRRFVSSFHPWMQYKMISGGVLLG